jgi:hypothetical protein
MTSNSDLSPEDVRKAQALAPQLDPDIARAITEGNVPVMQAIKRGATTDAEITQTLISMGLTTGLPPGLQQMVAEQMRQNDGKKRDADDAHTDRKERLASSAFGMGLTGGEGSSQTGSSGSSTVKSCATMSFAERTAYFGALSSMSYDDYARQSDPARQQHIDNVKAEGMAQAVEAKKELEKFPDKLLADSKLGASPEERQAAKERIYAAADYGYNAEKFHENLKNLSPAEREAAVALRALYYKANFGSNAHDRGNDAQDAKDKGNRSGEHGNVRDGADDLKQINDKIERDRKYLAELNAGTNKLNQVAAAPTVDVGKAGAARRQSDAALDAAAHSAQTKAEHDKLQVAGDDNLTARKTVDAKLASADHLAAATRDEYDDAPVPPERKSIDCDRMTCSQLEPPLPEAQKLAANDPAQEPPADPHQPQKPAVPRPKNDGTIT